MGRVRTERLEDVRAILENEPLEILIGRTPVRSRIDIYEYLLEELPFTAGVLRALGKTNYRIFRDDKAPDTFFLDDGKGMKLAAELVYRGPGKWVYFVWGTYSFVFVVRGSSVIVVTTHQKGGLLETEARVFIKKGFAVKAVPGLVEKVVRQKAVIFVDAAKSVAEAVAADPDGVMRNVRGSPEVDEEKLSEFERRFLKR